MIGKIIVIFIGKVRINDGVILDFTFVINKGFVSHLVVIQVLKRLIQECYLGSRRG